MSLVDEVFNTLGATIIVVFLIGIAIFGIVDCNHRGGTYMNETSHHHDCNCR